MNSNQTYSISGTYPIHEADFRRLSSFIMNHYGIKLPPNKRVLVQCRLQKRIKALQMGSFREYTDYVLSPVGKSEEVLHMIDAVSTNKTDFFREPVHFDYLLQQGITDYRTASGKRNVSVWSAGCSSGEEPYTLAMVFREYAGKETGFDFDIVATDIAESVLQHARTGIYQEEKTRVIPQELKKKYWLKGKNAYAGKLKAGPEIMEKVEFRMFNLLSPDYTAVGKFDFIFCRNVLIYFDRDLQSRILEQFCRVLNRGGLLFLGHSESINGFALPLKTIRPTIFMKYAES
jgi:chemotaxis protein methyltransferase CheR